MGIEFTDSAGKHGIDGRDALYVIQNAVWTSTRVKVNHGDPNGKRRVFVGPQHAQTDRLIEVLVELIPGGSVIYHVMPLGAYDRRTTEEERMALSEKDQDRYDRMAGVEETADGDLRDGASAHGADAAAIGRQMLLEGLGSEAAVARAVGRPRLDGGAPGGEHSPTIRVRVQQDRKERLERLRIAQHRKYASDLVRDAIDEYLERHEGDVHPIAS